MSARVSSNPGVFFSVQAADPGSTDSQFGIVTVVITYTEKEGGKAWQSMELAFNTESDHWEGTRQTPESINFLVQAIDRSGNVGMFAGNGYFTPVTVSVIGPSTAIVGQPITFDVSHNLDEPAVLWNFGDDFWAEDPGCYLNDDEIGASGAERLELKPFSAGRTVKAEA